MFGLNNKYLVPKQRVFKSQLFNYLSKIIEFLYNKTVLVLVIVFVMSLAVLFWEFNKLSSELTIYSSTKSAKQYSEALAEFRTLYTSEVIETLIDQNIKITHDYKDQEGAIPLPATLSMKLGKNIGEKGSGIQVNLFSPYPFPWREKEGGLKDNFKEDAWNNLLLNPNEPYFRFEKVNDRTSLRYATADRMRESCVNCHNSHPDTPKNDWKEGDVRGVLEVILPVDDIELETRSGLYKIYLFIIALSIVGVLGMIVVIARVRGDESKMKTYVYELEQIRENLEIVVRERTADLEKTANFLRINETKYRTLTENINVGIYRMSPGLNGKFLEVNPAMVKMFGYKNKKEMLAIMVSDIYPNLKERKLYNDKILEYGFVESEEIAHNKKDGSTFISAHTAVVVKDDNGEPVYFDGITEDISDRKKLENEKLMREKLESIGNIVVTLNHEMNQPLSVICARSEIIMNSLEKDNEIYGEIKDIHTGAWKIADLVKKIQKIKTLDTVEYSPGTDMIDLESIDDDK